MIADRSHRAREKTISRWLRAFGRHIESGINRWTLRCLSASWPAFSIAFAVAICSSSSLGDFLLIGGAFLLFFSPRQHKWLECTRSFELCVYYRLSPRLWRSVCHTCRRRFSNTTYARCIYAWIMKRRCVRMRNQAISSSTSHAPFPIRTRWFSHELIFFSM